jgi:hypothetical protein
VKTRWFDTGERNSFPFSPQTQSLHFPARASGHGSPGPQRLINNQMERQLDGVDSTSSACEHVDRSL